MVNGEQSLLVLAGAGSGKTSVLVARAGWLLARGEAAAEQILLLAFGRKAAQEMDERIRERLNTQDVTARTFHSLALHIIQQGSKKFRQSANSKMILPPEISFYRHMASAVQREKSPG